MQRPTQQDSAETWELSERDVSIKPLPSTRRESQRGRQGLQTGPTESPEPVMTCSGPAQMGGQCWVGRVTSPIPNPEAVSS